MRPLSASFASFEVKVLLAFGAAMLVVTGLAAITWKMAEDAVEAARMVARTHAVRDELASIRTATLQVEYSTQGYRISGNPALLAERDAAIATREGLLRGLQARTASDAQLQTLWQQLRQIINERLILSRKIEQLRKNEGAAAANAFVASAPLQQTRAVTYQILNAMDAEVTQLLERHSASQLRAQNIFAVSGTLVAVLLLALLTASYVLIQRQLRKTAASQRALAESEETVRQQNALLEQRVHERTGELLESEDHLRNVINNLPALIAYVDAGLRYVYVNAQYQTRFAPGQADIRGRTVREVLGDSTYAIAEPMILDVLQGKPRSYDWQPFPGTWQLVSYVPKHGADKQVLGYYVLIADITERKHAEEKIQSLNADLEHHVCTLERTGRALKTLSAGNRSMLRAADEQDLLDSMCRAIVDAGGYPAVAVWYRNDDAEQSLTPMAGEGYPSGLSALNKLKVTWADNAKGRGAVGKSIRTGQPQAVPNMFTDPNYAPWREDLAGIASVVACPLHVGNKVIGCLAIYGAEPDTIGTDEQALLVELADDLSFGIANLRNRQAQRETQEAMHRLTRYDELTGLPNETQFTEFLAAAIDTGAQFHQPFAVLQINIDRLNEINDALGFSHGDELLRAFGARLVAAVPDIALTARLRGDEFAILLPDSNAAAAMVLVKRLASVLSQPFPVADIPLDVASRIGVALYPEHGTTPHDLYRHVDSAVNQAKSKGANHVVFDPDQSKEQSRRLGVAGELRRAIENGDLLLYLQPKVEMASGKVCGAEGLVRWKHAQRGLIPPSEFIGLAEHTGLIKPLTEWVIETGLRLNQAWHAQGCALPIALNLSARNLRDENLLDTIRQLRSIWKVGAGMLELEITESSVMDDAEYALQVLHSLRDEGIPLYIDDFGTGYSSLAYLQKLPVNYIKIDQSFVRSMSTSKDSALIVRSTIDLVHDLGRKAVAEGVETQADWDQLAALGCDYAQGYFIAKPMPALELPGWMAKFQASGVVLA